MLKASAGSAERGVETSARRRRPGFTLIELLVVIMIIALVVAIILPALAGARTAAKGAATKAFMQEILKAGESWRLDKQGKAPGYFSARDMGRAENTNRGLTGMQNVMLDLMGGVTVNTDPNLGANDPKNVGPTASDTVAVNVGLMGSQKGYFSPDGKHVKAQDTGLANATGEGVLVGVDDHKRLPCLVDSWGNPILLWAEDQTAIGGITLKDQFALIDSGAGDQISRFYWASNAGLLNSPQLGKTGKNQVYGGAGSDYSLIGGGVPGGDVQDSLIGILGNPSFPSHLVAPPPLTQVVPTQPRGRVVLESAGPDGVYFGSKDPGYNRLDHKGPEFKEGVIMYLNNFFFNNGSLTRYTDSKGNPTTESVTDKMDDILVTGGG